MAKGEKGRTRDRRTAVQKMDEARMDFLLGWNAVRHQLFDRFPIGSLVEWEDEEGTARGVVCDLGKGYDVTGDPHLTVIYLADEWAHQAKLTAEWAKKVKLRVLGRAKFVLDPAQPKGKK